MGGLFVAAVLVLLAVRGAPGTIRALRAVRRGREEDRPARLLSLAVRALPPERADWGGAMCAELSGVRGGGARWSFAFGCARTAVGMRARAAVIASDRGGARVRLSTFIAIGATVALGLYGIARYPGLRSGPGTWLSAAAFLLIVAVYAAGALTLSRGTTRDASTARGYGVAGGLVVGGGWMVVLAPLSKTFFIVPLAIALVAPVAVAVLAARRARTPGTGREAALWSGLVGGLLVFIVTATLTYSNDGRPYDRQLLRDFHASGSHDLVAYAVSDALGGALSMLLIIPVVALALGSLAESRPPATTPAPRQR
jgi:hypothetical protein